MSDDFSADRQTSGRVVVGGSARGEIETAGDRDWFAFTLEAGKTYRFDLKGWVTNDGTLLNPYLRGIHDASGALIAGTANDDGGKAINSMVDFTAAAAGVYYVSAGSRYEDAGLGRIFTEGTYVLSVKHVPRPGEAGDPPSFGSAGYAFDLGENADGGATPVALGSVSAVDPEGKAVRYAIVGGNAAGLFAINAETGALTYTGAGKVHEPGTSHALTVRANDGSLHVDTTVTVTVIEAAKAPSFGSTSYAFDLGENADGSATPVALGSVSATDPDGDAVRYSIVEGNASGL
ncbi:MAG: cadherin domain-containing protein, partial [Chloroflexota bacterium]|nr:cadherin domain-containing protein [Chloroflexota bacterium]